MTVKLTRNITVHLQNFVRLLQRTCYIKKNQICIETGIFSQFIYAFLITELFRGRFKENACCLSLLCKQIKVY